jgi:hypothetical protein
MGQIVIRNIDSAVIEALRRRAAALAERAILITADEAFAAAAARHGFYASAVKPLGKLRAKRPARDRWQRRARS